MNQSSQRIVELSADKRNALESRLLEKISAARKNIGSAGENQTSGDLSFSQESLWFLDQLAPNSALYNIAQAFRLEGKVDADLLEKAFQTVIKRHDLLRSNFVSNDGKPVLKIGQNVVFKLGQIDLRDTDALIRESQAEQRLTYEAQKPFNLASDLLIRATLIRLSETNHFLGVVVHHIVSDFSSLVVMYRELNECYSALATGREAKLPDLKVQFPQWAARQKARIQGDVWDRKLEYWKQKLSGELVDLELPLDWPRPARQSFVGEKIDFKFSAELLARLKELSRTEGTTLYLTLLTAFQILLQRYSNQSEIVIGSPIDQRNTSDAENLIGYFINTVPLRTRFSSNLTFAEAHQEVRKVALEAFVHQETPFEKMVEALQLPRTSDRNPIFQVVFQYLPALPVVTLCGVAAKAVPIHTGTSKFDMTVTVAECDGMAGEIEFNSEVFERATIERITRHFEGLLTSIIDRPRPGQRICDLALLTENEERRLLVDWNQTETKYPREACVHELFEDQTKRTPTATALVFEGHTMTYQQLNERADQVAASLRQTNVGPGTFVGICIERSFEMIVGLLAILKAGAVYVPLDASYPRERLDHITQDTGIKVLLTTSKYKHLAAGVSKAIYMDEPESLGSENIPPGVAAVTANSPAYVMYTSGSTGKPKGVMIPHRGIVRLVKETNYIRIRPTDVFLQFAPISFDASTLEIWGALLNGAKLVIHPPEMSSLEAFGDFLLNEQITTLWLTAGLFHQMVDGHVQKLRGVKQLLAGGDVLAVPQVLKLLREVPECQLINGYGPTENTTFTCCYTVPRNWNGSSVPIGRPISNTTAYILDSELKPVPIGVAGELYVGGDGLALGYLNAPDLSEAKFIPNPFRSGAKLYRTGDRVRWLADGTIEFLGRFDNQVKVRGFRVELGEVEKAIAQHPHIKETTVLARQNCIGKELVAYFVPNSSNSINASDLRAFLQQKIPSYMVPAHLVALEKFPLTPNGKIDRRKLPQPEQNSSAGVTPPRNEREQKLHTIWCEVLGKKQIGIDENFFELGGHSLLATQIISRAGRVFGQDLPLRTLFEHPTIAAFAEAISSYRGPTASEQIPIRKRTRTDAVRLDQLSDADLDALIASQQRPK